MQLERERGALAARHDSRALYAHRSRGSRGSNAQLSAAKRTRVDRARASHQCAFVFGEGCGPCAAQRPWHTARPRGLRSGMGCQPAACLRPPAQAATVRTSTQRIGKQNKAKLLASVHFATCYMPRHVSSQMQCRCDVVLPGRFRSPSAGTRRCTSRHRCPPHTALRRSHFAALHVRGNRE